MLQGMNTYMLSFSYYLKLPLVEYSSIENSLQVKFHPQPPFLLMHF